MEDRRFLTGSANYVDDSKPANVAYMGILRSPYAHAKIKRIDFTKLSNDPNLIATLSGKDVSENLDPIFETPGQRRTGRHQLAVDIVRFVGEGVAAVLSKTMYSIEDLLEMIEVEYEPLPVVSSIEDSKSGKQLVYPNWGDNVALVQNVERGDADSAIASAAFVSKTRVGVRRQAGVPMEPRSLVASYDPEQQKYTFYASVQSVQKFRAYLSKELRVPPESVRFFVKDVGGGFGTKGAQSYPEFALAALLARKTGLSIKWTSNRTEDLLETSPDRDQYCEIELACDENAKLVALRAKIESDVGVLGTFNISLPHTIMLLPGAYDIPNIKISGTCYVTNKVPTAPVRGAGRPEACFFIESAIDSMAREAKMDPLEFRMRNVVRKFPHDNGAGVTYDSGNYPLLLETLSRAANYRQGRAQSSIARFDTSGRSTIKGVGISLVIEDTGAQMFETASVLATSSGRVVVSTGTSPHGQGLETTLSQLCSAELGIPIERVSLSWGDTDVIPQGLGTFASRSLSVGGSAVLQACRELESTLVAKSAEILGRAAADLRYEDGGITDALNGSRIFSFDELLSRIGDVKVSTKFTLRALPVASGSQFCELEVDTETGKVTILRIVIVDDCGRVINPTIVDGQIHGGFAHGLGGALFEELAYDANCQPLASSLMEYVIPSAETIPSMEVLHIETPSTVTLSGAKGVGESGTIGAYPSIFNALNDALSKMGREIHEAPATPHDIHSLLVGHFTSRTGQ